MALDFTVKDVLHKVFVKFAPTFLPDAKKKYRLKAVHQPELDIHALASKGEVYNISTDPAVIEEGFTAGAELLCYLLADGYEVKLPFGTLRIRFPGEYDGTETHLPPNVHPEVRFQMSPALRAYVRERVQVVFDGIDTSDGIIGEVRDDKTGIVDQVVTIDNLITIHGYGLKIESDDAHAAAVGVFFVAPDGQALPAKALAVNEPRRLKVLTPETLVAGTDYHIRILTQTSTRSRGNLLQDPREVLSEFSLTAQQ